LLSEGHHEANIHLCFIHFAGFDSRHPAADSACASIFEWCASNRGGRRDVLRRSLQFAIEKRKEGVNRRRSCWDRPPATPSKAHACKLPSHAGWLFAASNSISPRHVFGTRRSSSESVDEIWMVSTVAGQYE
jgi:hypothetical protein